MINKILNKILNWVVEGNPKNLKVERSLCLTKKYQKERFNKLKEEFELNYNKIPKGNEDFVVSFWAKHVLKIKMEEDIGFDFLRIPSIEGTMVITNQSIVYMRQLKYLEKRISEEKLKYLLEEDIVGSPRIINHKYKTSHSQIHNLYHLIRYIEHSKVNLKSIKNITEWGGGYGCLAKVIKKINQNDLTYTIIDLPIFSCIQWAYLSTVFGRDKVNLIKDKKDKIVKGKINILPISLLKGKKIRTEIFISNWALSESTKKAQDYVLSKEWFGAKYIFMGFQESNETFPNANNLNKILNESGALIEDYPLLKRNHYGILIK